MLVQRVSGLITLGIRNDVRGQLPAEQVADILMVPLETVLDVQRKLNG
jgi:hypothetical protein